jgi:P4 family phage/plasmid primase-like protien
MKKDTTQMLDCFPDHCYRYLDRTGANRPPVSSATRRDDLNVLGYDSYFTPNGFADFKDNPSAIKENCTSLNGFFVDIDGRKDWGEIEGIIAKLEPTFVLETFHGYHLHWLLDEPIYKNEVTKEEWEEAMARWERLEQDIVDNLKGDNNAKDIPRILRVPNSYYWEKGSGEKYKEGTKGVFQIIGKHKNIACRYSMDTLEEAFPPVKRELSFSETPLGERTKKFADAERKDFFNRVNAEYPLTERDSFKKLISALPETLPNGAGRNNALLVTASLMKQAGWTQAKVLEHLQKTGWHGLEMERGGWNEIQNTVSSAFARGYTFGFKNEIIAHNMTPEEQGKIQDAFASAVKQRKELDKIRFADYEKELLLRYPFLRRNEIGTLYEYQDGVYTPVNDLDLRSKIFRSLDEDMLVNYKTNKNVSDKISCLLSILPKLNITEDDGKIINVQNGLLNIYTKELLPHTPNFVSLIQYPVVYDPEAKCPNWEQCVDDWMKGPEQEVKTRLVKQFCGYTLSSSMLFDRALFMVGDGGNGKSTFIDTIAKVIGDKATSHIDLDGLYGQFGMAGLVGKRLNIIEEVRGNYYESNKLKKLISGETVTIDMKYKEQFTFKPQAKFVFAVNEMPRVDDVSTATERRICAVTFLNNYRKNPNPQLRAKAGGLGDELSGILNWMIEGAIDLKANGNFVVTEEQTRMLAEYREENSSVEGFIKECIVLAPEESIETPDLYLEYKKWCQSDGGRKTKAKITFTKEMKAYGAKDDRFTFAPRQYGADEAKFVGIKLSPHWTAQTRDKTWDNTGF